MTLDDVAEQLARLREYNSGPFGPGNPRGLANDGHVTNFPAALADVADVADAIAEMGPTAFALSNRNLAWNPALEVAQLGPGPFASPGNDIDGFYLFRPASVVTLPPGNPTGCGRALRVTLTSNTGSNWTSLWGPGFSPLFPGTAVISFWARVISGACATVAGHEQKFNSAAGGASSVWVSAQTLQQPLTSTWQRLAFVFSLPSIAGLAVGPRPSWWAHIGFMEAQEGSVVELTGFQIERGATPSPLELPPRELTLQRARRFLWTTYDQAAPGTQTMTGSGVLRGNLPDLIRLPVPMEAAPTVTTHRPDGAGSGTSAAPTSHTISLLRADATTILLQAAAAPSGSLPAYHVVARAPLPID